CSAISPLGWVQRSETHPGAAGFGSWASWLRATIERMWRERLLRPHATLAHRDVVYGTYLSASPRRVHALDWRRQLPALQYRAYRRRSLSGLAGAGWLQPGRLDNQGRAERAHG